MAEAPSIWFRIGYALESARQEPAARRLRGLLEREGDQDMVEKHEPGPGPRQRSDSQPAAAWDDPINALMTAGAGALVGRVIGLIPARRKPGMMGLMRAGAAGAGAALLSALVEPLLRGERRVGLDEQSGNALVSGAARGLLYATVLEPRIPGPSVVQGVVYGSVEFAVSPWGGLTRLLGDRAPHRRIPLLNNLFDDHRTGDATYADHLIFGIALALFYGRGADDHESSGIAEEE
jgi:hypothetical protein